jgi:hypothetical protein
MTSFKQIEANQRNARKSTGPITQEGKQRSRQSVPDRPSLPCALIAFQKSHFIISTVAN